MEMIYKRIKKKKKRGQIIVMGFRLVLIHSLLIMEHLDPIVVVVLVVCLAGARKNKNKTQNRCNKVIDQDGTSGGNGGGIILIEKMAPVFSTFKKIKKGGKKETHLVSDAAVGAGQRSWGRQGRRRLLRLVLEHTTTADAVDAGWRQRDARFLFGSNGGGRSGCRAGPAGRIEIGASCGSAAADVAEANGGGVRLARAIRARIRPECGARCETFAANQARLSGIRSGHFFPNACAQNILKNENAKFDYFEWDFIKKCYLDTLGNRIPDAEGPCWPGKAGLGKSVECRPWIPVGKCI